MVHRIEESEVFLPDCVPAYITLEQFQRNREQLQRDRTSLAGPVRAGSALLSGIITCGRCGMRMNAQYNNNGHTGRYEVFYRPEGQQRAPMGPGQPPTD
jgi:hypothetical protein